ncbi:MAG: chromosome condensation regulator [Harvfovirus sp.]|uniref:Chromosome condensation regulator n=1 Tax=Harvfovirus sp. TaxID=2487768 RepID=A0A3G5A441_9VIRU|nr:MAG: chromosome condensation regulator [Harvfovirus sp.]
MSGSDFLLSDVYIAERSELPKAGMDEITLVRALPIDLQYIVSSYYHQIGFIFRDTERVKYDWFRLLKLNFEQSYSKITYTNTDIKTIYLRKCSSSSTISCGGVFTIMKQPDGTLMFCGTNTSSFNKDDRTSTQFNEIKGIPKNIAQIISGSNSTIILLTDGTLMSRGSNTSGQLGHGDKISRHLFKKIENMPKNVAEIAIGGSHTIIRLTDGTLMSCGTNNHGELGLDDFIHRSTFEQIRSLPKNIVQIVCGFDHTMIRLSDGTVMSCGCNSSGQLGLGDTLERKVFHKIPNIPKNVAEIYANLNQSIIKLTDGTLMISGRNCYNSFDATWFDNVTFKEMYSIPKNIVEISCGFYNVIIKLSDGTLMGYGWNRYGQLGLGDQITRTTFVEIDTIPKNIEEISCGASHTIIKLTDGRLMSCGYNASGELGLKDTTDRYIFTEINYFGL